MKYIVGVDIGATKINFVLTKGRRVLKVKKILTPKTKKKLIEAVKETIKQFSESGSSRKICGVGIGIPGPLNEKGDLILNPPNLRCLWNCPLAKIIEKDLGIKTRMDNDANCFILAEALLGAGRGAKMVFGVTLGTGVGGGLVVDGRLQRGAFGSAGEVGHMTIKFDGKQCTCGARGCFEEYASERFILREAKVFPRELGRLAEKGNKESLKIFEEYGRLLGIGLANVVNLLDPEVIVIGGGIIRNYKFFSRTAQLEMKKRVFSPLSRKYVKIKRAKLGDLAGAIGAALIIK